MLPIPPEHPLRRLFAGVVEHSFFAGVGMADPLLTEYLAELLVTFTHIDQLKVVSQADEKALSQVAHMLALVSAENLDSAQDRDRLVYRHIGDYTLFWAGVYPEQLRRARCDSPDLLLDYVQQGKRSYAIVGELVDEEGVPPARLFRQLSEEFETCIEGLHLVRKELERDDGTPTAGGDLIY
jgi:hypothetical protein